MADRLEVYDVQTVHEAQEQLNLEAASSAMFNAVYLMEADGTLYSSSYVCLGADEHAYDELMEDGREHFAMLYDDENGRLETTKESLIFGHPSARYGNRRANLRGHARPAATCPPSPASWSSRASTARASPRS